MRPKVPALIEALAGRFASHHAVVVRAILAHIDFLDADIAALDEDVAARLGPFRPAIELLKTIPGVGQSAAEVFVAETGGDMSRFPTAQHLAAWAGLAPANAGPAGKHRRAGSRKGANWLGRAFIEAAKSASRSRGTYLSAQYRNVAVRRGPNKATVAVAHSIAVAAWHMLSTGEPYHDLGADWLSRRRDPEREARRLVARLEAMGHKISIAPAA